MHHLLQPTGTTGKQDMFWHENGAPSFLVEVGYAGGEIENPSYQDVCTGATNHNEVVRAGSSQWKKAQLVS